MTEYFPSAGPIRPLGGQLLTIIGIVTVPATTAPFVAGNHFVVNTANRAPGRIYIFENRFKKWFLSKTEDQVGETTLRCHTLGENSLNAPIVAELGGEERAETTLAQIFAIIKVKWNAEEGTPLTSCFSNIFYVRDAKGVLRVVSVFKDCFGSWHVEAYPFMNRLKWSYCARIFSRNPQF